MNIMSSQHEGEECDSLISKEIDILGYVIILSTIISAIKDANDEVLAIMWSTCQFAFILSTVLMKFERNLYLERVRADDVANAIVQY